MKPVLSMEVTIAIIMMASVTLIALSKIFGIPVTESGLALVISSTALFGVILIFTKEIR